MKIHHSEDYVKRRAQEYPSMGDQLDAIWKIIGEAKPDDPMVKAILQVKATFPKSK